MPQRPSVGRVATALVLVAMTTGCAQELHDAAWDDLVTARQQEAIDRGWVPEWLPEAATDLVEVDRPATGEVVVQATLPNDVALDACTITDEVSIRPDLADWWQPPQDGLRLSCDDGWWAIRADETLWAWSPADTPTNTEEST